MRTRTIALVDPYTGGHHDTYVMLFAKALVELGFRVLIISPSAYDIKQLDAINSSIVGYAWHPAPGAMGKNLWRAARMMVDEAERFSGMTVDLTFFAWIDSFLGRGFRRGEVDGLFPRPFSGLLFQPTEYRMGVRMRWLRRGILDRYMPLKASNCRAVATLDEGVVGKLGVVLQRRTVVFPDVPVLGPLGGANALADELRSRAAGRRVLLLTGSIDNRKGLDRFFETARIADRSCWLFVVAGPIAWHTLPNRIALELRRWISSPPPNGWVAAQDKLSEGQIDALIGASTAMWIAYENFSYSSNLLSKCASLAVPVLSNGEHLIGERVRRYGLGLIFEGRDAVREFSDPALAQRFERLAIGPGFQEGCLRLIAEHSEHRLGEAFSELLSLVFEE